MLEELRRGRRERGGAGRSGDLLVLVGGLLDLVVELRRQAAHLVRVGGGVGVGGGGGVGIGVGGRLQLGRLAARREAYRSLVRGRGRGRGRGRVRCRCRVGVRVRVRVGLGLGLES